MSLCVNALLQVTLTHPGALARVSGVPEVRAMYAPRPDARERSFAFLVTGVTMGCGDEPPNLCIVLARNKRQRTCPHRNCKNSLPRSRAATRRRWKRCCKRWIRSCVGSSVCACSTGGCAAPSTPRTFSNRCSRISCATRGRRARRNELGPVVRLPRCRRAPQGPDQIAQGTPPCG